MLNKKKNLTKNEQDCRRSSLKNSCYSINFKLDDTNLLEINECQRTMVSYYEKIYVN
jgi:hypothetical protein